MHREIGSEFFGIPVCEAKNRLFDGAAWFMSGRSALLAIIEELCASKVVKTAALPDWCCESMVQPFLEKGIKVAFYAALEPPSPLQADILLVVDYFGYDQTPVPIGFEGIVIRDTTHSLFTKQYTDAAYSFGSLRKWAGFLTGGYAFGLRHPMSELPHLREFEYLRRDAMAAKLSYLRGERQDKAHLQLFAQAESLLDRGGLYAANENDVYHAQHLDVGALHTARTENAMLLHRYLYEFALFEPSEDTCPLCYPILTPYRDALRRHLIENEIYCPVHWPLAAELCPTEGTRRIYEQELSLVCDQRYGEADMMRIVRTVQEFFEKR
ncbi:MAG: hypothetical protein E7650_06970 [Ruminococcaceae bacterium]|nr:hypothetical protein [Oscillospiraceae bacterium]